MDQVALGKRIKAARERAGMTQEDLAAAVEYSVDHMSVVERGVKAPKLDKLVTIANVLKVGTDELLQDNLDAATLLHATELSERLKALSPEGQRKVMNVLDTLVDELRYHRCRGLLFCRPLFFSTAFDAFPLNLCAIVVLQERYPFKIARSDTMKRKNISADTALLEVARRHNTTVDEVRKEIRIAMAVAMCSPDPDVQKRWREIPHNDEVLTPEDFIAYAARKCLERL